MGSPFLELLFGYGVKVKVKSEAKCQIGLKSGNKSPLLTDYVVRWLPNPECFPTKALSAEASQLQSVAVIFSQQRHAAWLSQVHGNDRPVEWVGLNAQQDRSAQ